MLYSQAVTGGHQASSSSGSPSTTQTHPGPTTTSTPTGTTKQNHTKPTNTARAISPHPRPQNQPNPDHKPNTPTTETTIYVLTLTTTPSLTDPLTALRRSHFPRRLDHHPAHLTLFHALPGSEMRAITAALGELCGAQRPLRLATGSVFRMRRGVGINVADAEGKGKGESGRGESAPTGGAAAARRLHGELQRRWWGFLSAQDRQKWRPHWTVQNKAADEGAVDAAMDEVRAGFRGAEGMATGCALWRYEKGGRWAFERGFDFDGDK